MKTIKPPLIGLVGPTASGKTDAALFFSRLLPSEMISADSMQIYRGMSVLSQAPAAAFMKDLKTHLVAKLDPDEEFSAARFRREAEALCAAIVGKRRVPLIVGGTGLYLRALLDGLFESDGDNPVKDESLRRQLAEAEKNSPGELHLRLEKIDPVSAKRIHPNDTKRLVRALEVYTLTGMPISAHQPKRQGIRERYESRIFLLDRDRNDLYRRIDLRVDQMIGEGLVAEVERLRKLRISRTAEVALGYREISGYLDGQLSLPEALELLKKNTRHYAKRQLSWFRHEKGVEVIGVSSEDSAADIAIKIFKKWGEGL